MGHPSRSDKMLNKPRDARPSAVHALSFIQDWLRVLSGSGSSSKWAPLSKCDTLNMSRVCRSSKFSYFNLSSETSERKAASCSFVSSILRYVLLGPFLLSFSRFFETRYAVRMFTFADSDCLDHTSGRSKPARQAIAHRKSCHVSGLSAGQPRIIWIIRPSSAAEIFFMPTGYAAHSF